MISAVIHKVDRDKLFSDVQPQFDDLLNLAIQLWGARATGRKDRDWLRETVVQGCFPLHPLTIFCLPLLNWVLAQNQRTMFQFIWDDEAGLKHFIATETAETDAGWIPLLSLDRLFGYFETSLTEKRLEFMLSYQDAGRKLSVHQVEQGLEGRLLRSLVMLEVMELTSLRTNADLMRHAIGYPASKMSAVAAALGELEKVGVLYITQAGYYQLVKPGGVDPNLLRRTIEQNAKKIRPLEKLDKPHDILAEKYNSDRGTSRQLSTHFVSLAMLDSPASLTQHLDKNDGVLWYVVSSSDQELDQARAKALQLTRQEPRLVVAVPRTPTDLLVRLQRKLALEYLRNTAEYKSDAYQDLLADAGQIGRDYIGVFNQIRQSFEQPQNFEWYRGGRTVNVTIPAHVSLLATTVMSEVFSDTPTHKTQQHLKPTGKSKYLENALNNNILQAPFKLAAKTKRGKKKAEDAILLDGAEELGLIRHERQDGAFDVYNVCAPTRLHPHSLQVWLLIDTELRQGTVWKEVVKTLSQPPYGLYPSVLQLFLAAFYQYNQDYLEIFSVANVHGSPLNVTGDMIIKLVESPDKYVLRYQPLSDEHRRFLRGLVERALSPGRSIQLQPGESASLRTRVAKLLRSWVGSQVPMVARQATVDELASILQSTPAETIEAGVALIQAAMQPQEAATGKALLDDLPLKVGLTVDSADWNDSQLDSAFAYLESACQALKRFDKSFKTYLSGQIGQYFGLTKPSGNWNDTLTAALDWRKNKVGQVRLANLGGTPSSRDLLLALDDDPQDFIQTFLIRLPHNWHFGMFEQWQAISTSIEYLGQLQQAITAVETRAAEMGVLVSEPTEPKQLETVTLEPPTSSTGSPPTVTTLETTLSPSPEPPISPDLDYKPSEKILPIVVTPAPTETKETQEVMQVVDEPTINTTLAEITRIINQLSKKDQYALWKKLQEIYDPQ